ncbi:hypothetical protein GV793_22685 [Nocardia cyriacigeorgica]|nr:hypothetical protein [Nocardia cyriacigeorgica]
MTVLRRLTTCTAIVSCTLGFALAAPVLATAAPDPAPAAAVDLPGTVRTATPGDLLGAYQSAVEALRALGVEPFLYPTAAAFCHDTNALGLVPAVAGAVPGPWPTMPFTVPGVDLSAVKAGQTMFAFVPYGITEDGTNTTGMQVAWLNISNGRGGSAVMGPMAEVVTGMIPPQIPVELRPTVERIISDFFLAALPAGGVRAVPVDTGSGTVLAAVFGTVQNGDRSCFFLPTVGITEVP